MPSIDESDRATNVTTTVADATPPAAAATTNNESTADARPKGSIDIDDFACIDGSDSGSEGHGEDYDSDTTAHDVTSLSPGCCSRFAALTGLDINEIKRELAAHDRHSSSTATPSADGDPPPKHRCHGPRSAFEGADHAHLQYIEKKAMALNRVDGPDDLYVGGVFALRRPGAMEGKGITHILSMIKYSFVDWQGFEDHFVHLSVDVDDVEDEDLLVHLPRAVRFIDRGLRGGEGPWPQGTALPGARRKGGKGEGEGEQDGATDQDGERQKPRAESLPEAQMRNMSLQEHAPAPTNPSKPGAVFVHCAMGKSRSVTAVLAYLLWKYPHRYGLTPSMLDQHQRAPDAGTARKAVQAALDWVRRTREIAEPNPGFMQQLEMWVMMKMPTAGGDGAVEEHPAYQRWLWEREVEESAKIGKAPEWIRFEDDHADEEKLPKPVKGVDGVDDDEDNSKTTISELRCKKCRRVLATSRFIIPHQQQSAATKGKPPCPHHFIEPLSWMSDVLGEGLLDGRLMCPGSSGGGARCGANIGRYAWQGFKCSCGEWVCPAFSLQASKVDETRMPKKQGPPHQQHGAGGGAAGGAGGPAAARAAALGIRMPPGRRQNNL
ncbi:putative tyrosine-protein phosphatase yvh1 [Diaporthe ampelina]|uniref:protein-tyrosine-phosphatase n=1 Tax=Diaporthe ampelina TaxID=1214573 RepID=A0A0G2FDG6_9PEZI|nr:putative tyrosine-protein phosphatase yvh1 [Diaporthe ampelina]